MIVERKSVSTDSKKKSNKSLRIARAIIFFAISLVIATITFYDFIPVVRYDLEYENSLVVRIVTYGDFIYLVLKASWQNWVLSVLFFGLGVTEIIEGVRK